MKHATIEISGQVVKSTGNWAMILLEPSLTMTGITKVKLKVTQLSTVLMIIYDQVMVLLCDVKVAKDIRSVWDYRRSPGEGAYSHFHNGGIILIN